MNGQERPESPKPPQSDDSAIEATIRVSGDETLNDFPDLSSPGPGSGPELYEGGVERGTGDLKWHQTALDQEKSINDVFLDNLRAIANSLASNDDSPLVVKKHVDQSLGILSNAGLARRPFPGTPQRSGAQSGARSSDFHLRHQMW